MKYLWVAFILSLAGSAIADDDGLYQFSARNVSLDIVCVEYTSLTGKKVEIGEGVDALITCVSEEKKFTKAQYIELIETKLKERNIGLFPIDSNRVVATWIDLSIPNPRSLAMTPDTSVAKPKAGDRRYSDRVAERRQKFNAAHQSTSNSETNTREGEAARQQEYSMELIRRVVQGETNGPSLPIPLTPELDAELVKAGILPPLEPTTETSNNQIQDIGTNAPNLDL